MSTILDEDEPQTDLRDMLMQTLEENGVLQKIRVRAQLRATVLLALEDHPIEKLKTLKNVRAVSEFGRSETGKLCLTIVEDFLRLMGLDSTRSVFVQEIGGFKKDECVDNDTFERLRSLTVDDQHPLLVTLMNHFEQQQNGDDHSSKMTMKRNKDRLTNPTTTVKASGGFDELESPFPKPSRGVAGIRKQEEEAADNEENADDVDDFFSSSGKGPSKSNWMSGAGSDPQSLTKPPLNANNNRNSDAVIQPPKTLAPLGGSKASSLIGDLPPLKSSSSTNSNTAATAGLPPLKKPSSLADNKSFDDLPKPSLEELGDNNEKDDKQRGMEKKTLAKSMETSLFGSNGITADMMIKKPLDETVFSPDTSKDSPEKQPQSSLFPAAANKPSMLGDLPALGGVGSSSSGGLGARNLPPLSGSGGGVGSLVGSGAGDNGKKDYMKLLNQSLDQQKQSYESSSSSSSSSNSSSPSKSSPTKKSNKPKLTKETAEDDEPAATGKGSSSPAVAASVGGPSPFKKASPRDDTASSISEEIVEDLEVGDMLSSGRSNLSF